MSAAAPPPLLAAEALTIVVPSRDGPVQAVRGVDFTVGRGEVVGLAGESGSGKTLTALSILGLLPAGAAASGRLLFEGRDLLAPGGRPAAVRGRDVAMVFQDPLTALHPMLSIGRQMTEHLVRHRPVGRAEAERLAVDMLGRVSIPNARAALHRYPHQFSGGMRQRIALASALVCGPKLLIADEPTTALDVTVQAGILRLIDQLRQELGLSVLLITHDLGVMSALADRVCVLYAGRVVECGPRALVLGAPRHPYTHGLIEALPRGELGRHPLRPLPGDAPAPSRAAPACAFHPRCRFAVASCRTARPPLTEREAGRSIACPVDPLPA